VGVSRPVRTVDQQNIRIAVIVIVDKSTTGAHGFRQPFFPERAIVVGEMDAGLRGDVTEVDLLGVAGLRRNKY
jgi:hypothetical protein